MEIAVASLCSASDDSGISIPISLDLDVEALLDAVLSNCWILVGGKGDGEDKRAN